MEVVKVSAKSVPKSVAGAIAAVIRENGEVEVQAVGAGASNQAVKPYSFWILQYPEAIWLYPAWILFAFPLSQLSALTVRNALR